MIVLVLRSGGIYTADDVARLVNQIDEQAPGVRVACLSDVDVPCERIPLAHGWPGWWSKMELYRLDLPGFLYMDLDTIVRGPLDDLLALDELALLRDFYREWGLGSGLMFLPKGDRERIWRHWIESPERWMGQYVLGGDQAFLERYWLTSAARIQDRLPGQVASYKANTRAEQLVARVVCFHGEPKPRDVQWRI